MKRILILVAINLLVCSTASAQGGAGESTKKKAETKKTSGTNAQTGSMTGTVISIKEGLYGVRGIDGGEFLAIWQAIVVQVDSKRYFVYLLYRDCKMDDQLPCVARKVGKVDEVGRKVRFFYTRIARSSDGYDGEVKATRIVEIKQSRRKRIR